MFSDPVRKEYNFGKIYSRLAMAIVEITFEMMPCILIKCNTWSEFGQTKALYWPLFIMPKMYPASHLIIHYQKKKKRSQHKVVVSESFLFSSLMRIFKNSLLRKQFTHKTIKDKLDQPSNEPKTL